MPNRAKTQAELLAENTALQRRLQEAEATLAAIRDANVDALVLSGPAGERIVPLPGFDSPYRVMVEALNEGALTLVGDGLIGYCNPRFAAMVQRPAEELIGAPFTDLLAAGEAAALAALLGQMAHSQARGDFHLRQPDGSARQVQLSGRPLQLSGLEAVVLVATDLTERVEAEARLRFQAQLLGAVGQAVIATDQAGRITYWNPAAEALYGWPAAEVLGRPVLDVVSSDATREQGQEIMDQLSAGASWSGQYTVRRRDGTPFPAYVTDSPVLDAAGRLIGVIGVSFDIGERQRSEEALRQSEESYRDLFENSIVGISQARPDGSLLRVNSAFARMYGYDSQAQMIAEVTDIRRQLYAHPEERDALLQQLDREGQVASREFEVVRRDGSRKFVLVTMQKVEDASGRLLYFQASHSDITDRKQAELETRQRLAELEGVQRISAARRTAGTAEEMLPVLLDETLAVLHTEAGTIWLIEDDGLRLRLVAARGWFTQIKLEPEVGLTEGLIGEAWRTHKPYATREFASDLLGRPAARALMPAGWGGAMVPILGVEQVVAMIQVAIALPRELQAPEMHLLMTLSEIAGSAIQRSRLHAETERQLAKLAALSEIDRAIVSTFDIKVVLAVLVSETIAKLNVAAADVLLLDHAAGRLHPVASQGFGSLEAVKGSLGLSEGFPGQVVMTRQLAHFSGPALANEGSRRAGALAQEAFVEYFAVPLIVKGQVKGVLEVFQRAPFAPDAAWLDFLNALAGQAAIAIDNATLFSDLQRSNLDLTLAYDATIEGWSRALDLRDKETEGHSLRVTELTLRLAQALRISEADLAQVRWGALLHDIGKMGIPDRILLKPGPLTDDEWVLMREHPNLAYQMLSPIYYLRGALDIPYCHHEKWDGSGYPRGLAGTQIPLSARAFAVVDVWDALRSDRPYRPAWPEARVRQHIQELAGAHFDPQVVAAVFEDGLFDHSA